MAKEKSEKESAFKNPMAKYYDLTRFQSIDIVSGASKGQSSRGAQRGSQLSNPYKDGWVAGDPSTGTPNINAEHMIKADSVIYVGNGGTKQSRKPSEPRFITPLQ